MANEESGKIHGPDCNCSASDENVKAFVDDLNAMLTKHFPKKGMPRHMAIIFGAAHISLCRTVGGLSHAAIIADFAAQVEDDESGENPVPVLAVRNKEAKHAH